MKIKNLITAGMFALVCYNLCAQNNNYLNSIDKEQLESLLKQHKQLHFVTTQGSNGPEVKFYVDDNNQETHVVSQEKMSGGDAINFQLVKDINVQTDADPVNKSSNVFDNEPYAI